MMNQQQAVIKTIERLGGVATLGQLYTEVFKIKDCEWKTKTPTASIRRIVQLNKDIYKIKPGLYGLVSKKSELESLGIVAETEKTKIPPRLQILVIRTIRHCCSPLGRCDSLTAGLRTRTKTKCL